MAPLRLVVFVIGFLLFLTLMLYVIGIYDIK